MGRLFTAFLSILILAGCASVEFYTPTPIPAALIKQPQAIDAGLNLARMSGPELSPIQGEPSNVKAEEMSLADAFNQLNIQGGVSSGERADQPVWLVSMDGVWYDEAPCQPGECQSTPNPLRHCSIILDAATALEIERICRP